MLVGLASMRKMRKAIAVGLAFGVLCGMLLPGCGRMPSEKREGKNRTIRRAVAARQAQDIDGSIALCQKALARNPDLSVAHLELALMMDMHRENYISAMYHYQRYLELRPKSEQRGVVEELLQNCRIKFATTVMSAPHELDYELRRRGERIRELELEVVALQELQHLGPSINLATVMPPVAGAAGSKNKSTGRAPPPPAAGTETTYVVQEGETLATVSRKHYGTTAKWQKIFEANRDRLTNANNVRAGTVLKIPADD